MSISVSRVIRIARRRLYISYMNSVRRYKPVHASMAHDAPLPGVGFTATDMLEWLSLDGWERVREIQVSGQGEDHGHLRHCCVGVDGELGREHDDEMEGASKKEAGPLERNGDGDEGQVSGMTVLDAMARYFAVPPEVGRLLIMYGAVHWARIPPAIPEALLTCPEEGTRHDAVRERARQLVVDNGELEGLSQSEQSRILLSKTDRVLDAGFVAKPYSYIRAHLWPKRFPLFHSVDWRDRVVAVGEEYVVINKPPGVPVPPTVDNVLENVQAGAAKALNVPVETLRITSRIDQPTEGLVVVGRTKAFVSRFNASMRGNATRKFYRAAVWVGGAREGREEGVAAIDMLAANPGDLRHRVIKYKGPGTPFVSLVCDGLDGAENVKDQMVDCHLIVRSVTALADADHCLPPPSEGARLYEIEIQLVTGRTHQIRCQMSALGLPLVGDDMYEALADRSLRERLLADPEGFQNILEDGTRVLREPEIAIGLQAFRLEFEGEHGVFEELEGQACGRVVFEAGVPWWRSPPRIV